MATRSSHNKNNSAVKRIMQEARELANDPSTDYSASPLEDDIFEWHCTLRGPAGSDFDGGLYHFRILLPAEYPFRPPAIMMLTPSGRFELNTKICISFTNYHEDLWQPAWGVRTAIIGLQGFFPLKGELAVGVGALEVPTSERKRLAALSRDWTCPHCNKTNLECLPDPQIVPASHSPDPSPSDASLPPTALSSPSPPAPNMECAPSLPTPVSIAQEETPLRRITIPTTRLRSLSHVEPDPEHDLRYVSPTTPSRAIDPAAVITLRSPVSGTATTPVSASILRSPLQTHVQEPAPAYSSRQNQRQAQQSGSAVRRRSSSRPPVLLDSAICVLIVLVLALLCRKFL